MKLFYTRKAATDVDIAFLWYEQQRIGLGFDFIDCLEVSLGNIQAFPEMYEKSHKDFRRCIIRRFPYSLFYTIQNDTIIVHAVLSNKSNTNNYPG